MTIKVPSSNLVLENVQITYRNFAGTEGDYNAKGDRNYAVWIDDPAQAEALAEKGWKVKYRKPEEDGTPGRAYMPVTVKYHPKLKPPMVKIIKNQGKAQVSLDEESVELIDFMDIEKCDMILRPYHWKHKSGTEGVKNMCSSIYVKIREDELELKYAHIPVLGAGNSQLAIGTGADFEDEAFNESLEDMGEIFDEPRAIGRGF
jgi:hypothetical protein